jgi:peptide/nickel transport system permease protein
MLGLLQRRLLQAILVVWGVSTLVFLLLHISGDPTLLMVPQGASQEAVDRLRRQLGFDQPLYVQYLRVIGGLVRGDLGQSFIQSRPTLEIILERLPKTAQLAGTALALALLVGVPAGIISAVLRGTWLDRLAMLLALLGQAMPSFWLGLLLILVFGVRLQWLPPSGTGTWRHLILPAITLGSLSMATFARMARSSFLEEVSREYVRTARAKGIREFNVVTRHLARNAAIPIITLLAIDIASLMGGAVITETIFAWPGMGQLVVGAIESRDYPLVQAVVVVGSILYVAVSLLADIAYALIDPRIRL